MLHAQNDFSRDCYERAVRARANAEVAPDPKRRNEFLAMEAGWLSLAESGSLVQRLSRFVADGRLHQAQSEVQLDRYWPVAFERGQVLIRQGQDISTVFFITDAVVSLVAPEGLELAMLGPDAGIGMLTALHGGSFPYEALVQVSGNGLACDVASFREAVHSSNSILQNVLKAEQQIAKLVAQSAVCAATHHLETRLARWLGRLYELSGCVTISVTQEELGALLCATRTSVLEAVKQLKDDGLLAHGRGSIKILDPVRLQTRACVCGRLVKPPCPPETT
jgi:CRP-like cAMP-binding protein